MKYVITKTFSIEVDASADDDAIEIAEGTPFSGWTWHPAQVESVTKTAADEARDKWIGRQSWDRPGYVGRNR